MKNRIWVGLLGVAVVASAVSFAGAQNGQGPNFQPPPGEDILSSSDVSECASEAQTKVPQNSGG